jgi:hypothetical protein
MNARLSAFCTVVCGALLIACVRTSAGQAGAVAGWGQIGISPVEPGTRFRAIAAGGYNLAITAGGTVLA